MLTKTSIGVFLIVMVICDKANANSSLYNLFSLLIKGGDEKIILGLQCFVNETNSQSIQIQGNPPTATHAGHFC